MARLIFWRESNRSAETRFPPRVDVSVSTGAGFESSSVGPPPGSSALRRLARHGPSISCVASVCALSLLANALTERQPTRATSANLHPSTPAGDGDALESVPSEPLVPPLLASMPLKHSSELEPTVKSHEPRPGDGVDEFVHGHLATFHPHGESVCASGCAASHHPTPRLSRQKFGFWMDQLGSQSRATAETALDTLLFFGRQSRVFLAAEAWGGHCSSQTARLRKQLAKTPLAHQS